MGDGESAARRLWAEAGLRVLPGAYMARPDGDGINPGRPYIRVALVHEPAVVEEGLGRRFHLMDVLVKSHAAAARVAAGIDAMLELRQQHKFAIGDIASMALGIPKIIQGRLTNPHPVDLQAAQMCLPFSVALAAKVSFAGGCRPDLTVADYEAALNDPSLFALEDRITIALDEEVEAASNELSTAARVSVRLSDGRGLSILVSSPISLSRVNAAAVMRPTMPSGVPSTFASISLGGSERVTSTVTLKLNFI